MKRSLKTISEMTGYSTATVSRALANAENVRDEVRKKILLAARRIGYVSGASRVLVIGEMLAPSMYYEEMLGPLADELYRVGFCAEFIAKRDVPHVLDRNFRGAVSLLRKGIEKYWGKHQDIPLVCINSFALHLHNIYSVQTDDAAGSRYMAESLIRLGHEKIGIYGESLERELLPESFYYLKRLEAFSQVMREHGLPDDLCAARRDPKESVMLVKSLLDRGCTAIIGNGESSGMELVTALHVLGVRIPEDVSVMSWITHQGAHLMYPPVSGVIQDFSALARHAVSMLQCQIGEGTPVSDIVLPPIQVAGASVGRCRKNDQ
ncbi:MAG: LacI family DNA-binding transcriptional regulator [Lentisphaeria bacterium]|nr:LacI family DNA-binding transcriptional regulator [Lentisphaeria bacterium]